MGVVRAALGVVPLDEQPWCLKSVVVRLSGFGGASPGEVDAVERGAVVRRERRDAFRGPAEVSAEQGQQQLALGTVEVVARDSLGSGRVFDGAVILCGESSRLVDRIAERLERGLFGVVRETIISPDAGQRDDLVARGKGRAVGRDEVRRRLV
jgi:hypothetical protein